MCMIDPGHMTNMAIMPIHGKKTIKISRTQNPMILELVASGSRVLQCVNDDPVMA